MHDMKGKVAVVTGGARGMGADTSVELARCGAAVAVVDRKLNGALETVRQCAEQGVQAKAYEMDQADSTAVEDTFKAIAADFGGVDLCFANAGTGKFVPLVDMAKEDWNMMIQVNLNGTFYVCQEAARLMIKGKRGGKIVVTSSCGAKVMADQLGAYCASKAGVLLMAQNFAAELGNYRINVNAILPGVIETGMTGPMLGKEEWRRMLIRRTPVGRWGRTDEIAKLVAFLLSSDSDYINGEGIVIDGGSTLHGIPGWYSLDYSKANECDWDDTFEHFPYKE